MKLYHKTMPDAANAILREGFRDGSGRYMVDKKFSGVWLSDSPLDVNAGGLGGEVILELNFDGSDSEIADFEWIEKGKGYREWLIPAALVNTRMEVRLFQED
jgi:hypothetical protein